VSEYDNIDVVMKQIRTAWADYPEMQYRIVVEAWDPNVGRMDARYASGYANKDDDG